MIIIPRAPSARPNPIAPRRFGAIPHATTRPRLDTRAEALARIRAARHAVGGYVALFGASVCADERRETLHRGAFQASIAAGHWFLLHNHVEGAPAYASMDAGTLHVEEDARGLWFEAALSNSPDGARLFERIRREPCGMSAGAVRGVTWEASIVTAPARPLRAGTWVKPNIEAPRERARLRLA